jgi:hypothetical protein
MRKQAARTPIYRDESRLFYIALSLCVGMFAAYMYFLSESVMHVVMRKEVDREISSTGTQVGELESQYIELQHSVSNEIASMQGYVPVEEKIFIGKTSETLVMSHN